MNALQNSTLVFNFKMEESFLSQELIIAIRSLLTRPRLKAHEIHWCAVMIRALERLPLVTPGIGLTLSLDMHRDDGSGGFLACTFEEDLFQLSEEETIVSQSGSDHHSTEVFTVGIDWRETDMDFVGLEDWIHDFRQKAGEPSVKPNFEAFGDNSIDWDDESTGEIFWEGLGSDYA